MTQPKPKKRPCTQCGKPNAVIPARLCPTCKRLNKKNSKAKSHEAYVQKTYGLKPGEYDKLFALQGGVCYICGGKGGGKKLAVDHDHVTGLPRGLLDRNCNYLLLGRMAKDDPEVLKKILENAMEYLRDPPYQKMLRNEYGNEEGVGKA